MGDVRTRWGDDDADALVGALEDLASPLLFGGAPALVIRRAEALSGANEALVLESIARVSPPSCLILVARGLDGRRTALQDLLGQVGRDVYMYAVEAF